MTNQVQEQVLDRKDLKIQALLEKISGLAVQYENAAADYRVELTIREEQVTQLTNHIQMLESQMERLSSEAQNQEADPTDYSN